MYSLDVVSRKLSENRPVDATCNRNLTLGLVAYCYLTSSSRIHYLYHIVHRFSYLKTTAILCKTYKTTRSQNFGRLKTRTETPLDFFLITLKMDFCRTNIGVKIDKYEQNSEPHEYGWGSKLEGYLNRIFTRK